MLEANRCKLGSSITKSPAQEIKRWALNNISRILFMILASILWLLVLYAIVGVVTFVAVNVAEVWPKETPAVAIYNAPYMAIVKVVGAILASIYVFNSTKRSK